MTSQPTTGAQGAKGPKRKSASRTWLLWFILLVIAGVGGYAYFFIWRQKEPDEFKSIREGLRSPVEFDKDYTDKNNDLIADAPSDPLTPKVLRFATLDSKAMAEGTEEKPGVWKGFATYLEKVTQIKVEIVEPSQGSRGGVDALKAAWKEEKALQKNEKVQDRTGVHILALNTGAIATAVNNGGFVPVAVPADKDGKFGYQMDVLVPKNSAIQKLEDLKKRNLCFGSLSSLSSGRLPILTLWKQHKWVPGREYEFHFGSGQRDVINKVHEGKVDVAFVASDLLTRMQADKKLDTSKVQSIYKSKESYPPFCFGHAHFLQPELAAKIKSAFMDYAWNNDGPWQGAYKQAGQVKFVQIDYKNDPMFVAVREMEKELNAMIEANK